MTSEILRYTFRFILLVLVQVLILNEIQFSGYLNPFLYILFIILLPVNTPKALVLILAFVLGLTIDMFSDTGGIHAAASVFIAFSRPFILYLVSPREDYEYNRDLNIRTIGFKSFLAYSVITTLVHHTIMFYLEVFKLSYFFNTFLKVLVSSVFTIILILLTQFLFSRAGNE